MSKHKHITKKNRKTKSHKHINSVRKTSIQRQKTKKKTHFKYLFGGFGRQNRNNFRNMFIKNLKKIKNAEQNQEPTKINQSLVDFSNGFSSNHLGINYRVFASTDTFEPIEKESYEQLMTQNINLYPCLVLIFANISDNNIRKKIITSFIENGGNINLKSSKGDITALSYAIDSGDRELVVFLRDNGADPNTLNEQQKTLYDEIIMQIRLKEEERASSKGEAKRKRKLMRQEALVAIEESVPVVIQESVIQEPVIKLIIPTPLPSEPGYPLDLEPEFWLPLFGPGNMVAIREKIHSMMIEDSGVTIVASKLSKMWSVCQIIQTLIPTYYVPTEFKPIIPGPEHTGPLFIESPIDFSNYNILLCAALLVFGIISKKMEQQDYKIIFKGGKAIQLVLGQIPQSTVYQSEDIDVLVMPKDSSYNMELVKNLSGHITYLVKWFLKIKLPQTPGLVRENIIDISVLRPNPNNPRSNPFIFKLSYIQQIGGFKPISDIDFKEIPENIKPFFEKSVNYQFLISELDERVTFTCPNIVALLEEKLYYYALYTEFKSLLLERQPIRKSGYETLTVDECNRLLDKFSRAIVSLNKGLQMQRFPSASISELHEKESRFVLNRLEKLGINNKDIQNLVIEQLYSGK
jgi:hypothetical protein